MNPKDSVEDKVSRKPVIRYCMAAHCQWYSHHTSAKMIKQFIIFCLLFHDLHTSYGCSISCDTKGNFRICVDNPSGWIASDCSGFKDVSMRHNLVLVSAPSNTHLWARINWAALTVRRWRRKGVLSKFVPSVGMESCGVGLSRFASFRKILVMEVVLPSATQS